MSILLRAALGAYDLTTQDTFFYQDVADGGSYRTADVGVVQKTSGTTYSIKDRVWLDSNGDAGKDDGEKRNHRGDRRSARRQRQRHRHDHDGGGRHLYLRRRARRACAISWRVTDQNGVLTNYFGTTSPARAGVFQMPGILTGNSRLHGRNRPSRTSATTSTAASATPCSTISTATVPRTRASRASVVCRASYTTTPMAMASSSRVATTARGHPDHQRQRQLSVLRSERRQLHRQHRVAASLVTATAARPTGGQRWHYVRSAERGQH